MKTKITLLFSLYLLGQIIIIQFSTHHIETLDWDINSFLVVSQEFGRGNLPFENQYENKPPLLFFAFYIFSFLAGDNVLYIKIINDLIIFLLAFSLLIISNKNIQSEFWSFVPSIIFIFFISNIWFHPEYSEYISLLFIASAYIVLKTENIKQRSFLSGLLISFSTLINLGTIFFVLGLLFVNYLNSKQKLKSFREFVLGFSSLQILIFFIYYFNGLSSDYFMSMIKIPLTYSETNFSLVQNITTFLKAFQNYNTLIYVLLIISISLFISNLLSVLKSRNFNKNRNLDILIMISCSMFFYIFAKKGYYHHLIFLLYFCSLTFSWVNTGLTKRIIFTVTIFSIFSVNTLFFPQSFENLKNLNSIENKYPIKILSEELKPKINKNQNVFSTNHILILYYFNVPNYSYIVHPALYDYPEITEVLIKNKKINQDEVEYIIRKSPDVLEGNFELKTIDNSYYKLDTKHIDLNLLEYWEKDRSINIFISK